MDRVFVTIEDDARGDQAVNAVFSTNGAAVEYVINTLFEHDELYSGQTRKFLEEAAESRIVERQVEGT